MHDKTGLYWLFWLYFKTRENNLTCLFPTKDINKKKPFIVEHNVEKTSGKTLERAHSNISKGEDNDKIGYFSLSFCLRLPWRLNS